MATYNNCALIRLVHSRENIHQGCLPGTVFTQNAVNFSGVQVEVDIIIGHHSREGFGDAEHFYERIGFHGAEFVRQQSRS